MQIKILIFSVIILLASSFASSAQEFDRGIVNPVFMPKGQWMAGGTISYKTNDQSNFKFLFVENWNGNNYDFRVTPYFLYTFKDNTGIGAKFSYRRTFNQISSFDIKIDDNTSLSLKDYESVSHMFYSTAFLRNYLALGESKRFGLYVDTELSYGFGQSKITSGTGPDLDGTYETINEFQIGVVPGLCAFINDNVALEVSVDVLGISFKNVEQEFNRIDTGSLTSSGANFKIDLFSVKFGVSIYF